MAVNPPIKMRRQRRARQKFKTQAAAQKYYAPKPAPAPAPPKPTPPPGSPKNPAVVKVKQPRIVTARQGYRAATSTPGMVVFAALLLLIFSQWSNFFGPYLSAIIGTPGPALNKTTDPKLILGALIFIAIMAGIAAMSEEAGGVILLSIFAMWLLWVMFAGRQTFAGFFKFFTAPTPNTQTGSGNPTPAPKPVVPVASPKT